MLLFLQQVCLKIQHCKENLSQKGLIGCELILMNQSIILEGRRERLLLQRVKLKLL